jgi:hypothetical protein
LDAIQHIKGHSNLLKSRTVSRPGSQLFREFFAAGVEFLLDSSISAESSASSF